jgi:hypothetical protein
VTESFRRRHRRLADLADTKNSIPNPPAAVGIQEVHQLPANSSTLSPGWRIWRIWRQNQIHTSSSAATRKFAGVPNLLLPLLPLLPASAQPPAAKKRIAQNASPRSTASTRPAHML